MSYQTRRPGGGWSSISSASPYSYTVANYASVIAAAQQSQENTEIETKIFNYKQGLLSYDDLKTFLQSKLTGVLAGSQKELDLKEILVTVEGFETAKNRDIKRADLKTRYAKGGISAREQLEIERAMLPYYKEGTSEYSEQLSNIAVTTELAAQEERNVRVAELQSKLSEGGLTTDEEISIYEEARDMSEPGTEERANFEKKINEAKTRKEDEDIQKRANQKYLELLDKYKDGGLTNEESLDIVREMQSIYKPGTEEFTKMKESEAELLGAIAKEKTSGAKKVKEAEEEAAKASFLAAKSQLEELETELKRGISPQQTINKMFALAQEQADLVAEYGDAFSPDMVGELQGRLQKISQIQNDISTGNAVMVKVGDSYDVVPVSQLSAPGFSKEKQVGKGFENVITVVDENGIERQFVLNENNDLEELDRKLTKDGKELLSRTGNVLPKKTQTLAPAEMFQTKVSNIPVSKPASTLSTSSSLLQTPMNQTPYTGPTVTTKPSSNKSSSKSSTVKASVPNIKLQSTPVYQTKAPLQTLMNQTPYIPPRSTNSSSKKSSSTGLVSKIVTSVKSLLGNLFR